MTRIAADLAPRGGAATTSARQLGTRGTAARVLIGSALVVDVLVEQSRWSGLVPSSWLLGLLGLPVAATAAAWLRARCRPERMSAIGGWGHLANLVVFLGLYLPQQFVPGLSVLWDGGLIFVGASMLLAAVRGYAGCELLAVSNWLLGREDQLGCVFFVCIDQAEAARAGQTTDHDTQATTGPTTLPDLRP